MSIHGRIAADLALHHSQVPEWFIMVPPFADFESTVPFLWSQELQDLLPREANDISARQRSRSERDWTLFTEQFPNVPRGEYLHAWLLVSTRAFYWETPDTLPYPWDDRLAMLPIADLFNHSATGCSASFNMEGYTIDADKVYKAGAEISTSYGTHSNDYLLAEYGFMLDENEHDRISLDDVILPKLTEEQVIQLEQDDVLCGQFMFQPGLDEDDKTWDVLRVMCNGDDDAVQELLKSLLQEYELEVKRMQRKVEGLTGPQGETIIKRWKQVAQLTQECLNSL